MPVPNPPSFAQISAAFGVARYLTNAWMAGVLRKVMISSPLVSIALASAPAVIAGNGTTLKSVTGLAFVACRISLATKSASITMAALGGVA